ncbi:hypothetical protein RRG08_032953 [Elysia crispata]|uniref:Uncharacterized protein n=1 Tax=Elysia crispata TaxID=231223 RepID=A0AAE1D432_9GAST|nr:hypothetical protein RRG08_032953 [Elysia crispata]
MRGPGMWTSGQTSVDAVNRFPPPIVTWPTLRCGRTMDVQRHQTRMFPRLPVKAVDGSVSWPAVEKADYWSWITIRARCPHLVTLPVQTRCSMALSRSRAGDNFNKYNV